MIVLSVGMPRAGSGWHYNLIHDLIKTNGLTDARDIRDKYGLQKILTEVNCNIGVLSVRRLGMVTIPALMGNTFVIKAHAGPSLASRILSTMGLLRITYIYRDPRDVMLSAFEYGQRALANGRPNAFSHLSTFENSIDFMMEYVYIWERWMNEKNVHIARYEDLLVSYDEESARLMNYLTLDRGKLEVQKVIEDYRPGVNESKQGLHFFKGKVGRFREVYNEDQKLILSKKLADYLPRMGYEP